MQNRGKLVIVGILTVALAASLFSVYYHYRAQHHALDLWGNTSAQLIAESPEVEVVLLGDETDPEAASADDSETRRAIESGDRAWKIASSKDARQARGMNNVRRALVTDTTFDWDEKPAADGDPHWTHALVFNDGRNWATVLFDFDSHQIALTGSRKTGRLNAMASDDLKQFFQEQFADAGNQPAEAADKPAQADAASGDNSDQAEAAAQPAEAEGKPTAGEAAPPATEK